MRGLIGLGVGIVAGCLQFWLLSKFTKIVSSGSLKLKNVLVGLGQFFLPLIVLYGVALFRRHDLLWTGIGIIAALIAGAVIKYIVTTRNLRGGRDKDE